ncbi:ribulose-phosphate 3-epimerase [Microbacter margulisiae]|uniref:Ribulose-phosphate 3-epimerase n=1 Tax=Microbacter margulisiae TaxID=1350067 RepID=A0A7W5DS02_9PORP|nr:ribulose-phosphate 3-epimerase [Microbacter margulisiae]MBB3187990.1 ribulose-phosphate 3-epimerase [Microbacter margulisiae]
MATLIAPSLLAANFANLQKDIEMINRSEADWFHLDIMDGVFVPNISFGFSVIDSIQSLCKKPMDAHLMIIHADNYIERFKNAGINRLTVHYEACTHLHRTIQQIQHEGMKAGVALNPHTPVFLLQDVIKELDTVLIMSVNPGFGGQTFIEQSCEKISELKELILKKQAPTLIEVDGGVNLETGAKLIAYGADVLVAGQFVFGSESPEETIYQLKHL